MVILPYSCVMQSARGAKTSDSSLSRPPADCISKPADALFPFRIPQTMFTRPFVFALLALAAVAHAAPHRYDHVVIVIEENTDYAQVLGDRENAPFINELADGGVNFTEFHAITHPSQPNYLHLFSGDNQGVVSNSRPLIYPWSAPNLGAALIAAGATFGGYSEDLPAIGDRDTNGTDGVIGGVLRTLYRRKHNPWANWQAAEGTDPIPANQLRFDTNLRFLDFPADFTQIPAVAIVVPNQQNDMHDGTVRMGDDWLRENFAAYAKWARTHNSLLIVAFDEDNLSGPNKIPTVFYGAALTPGTVNATRWTLHNLLRTIEDMHDAAHSGRAAKVRPVTGVFPGDPPVLAVRFRQGENGYAGAGDTMLRAATPTADESATTLLSADLDTDSVEAGDQPAQILVRFDNLFGPDAGQVPLNAIIISAKLSLWTGAGAGHTSADLASLHRMLIPWSDTDTWDSLVNGVDADDADAALVDSFTHAPTLSNAPVIFDVTADIAAFLADTPNRGWVIHCSGPDGWFAYSSEHPTTTVRPTLQIAYTLPVAAGYPAWQLAKFGANAGAAGSFPEDDPDIDGTANLLEYALNANPLRSFTAEQPTVSSDGAALAFTFTRNLDATDIALRVEATDNLAATPWSPIATWAPGIGWDAIAGVTVSDTAGAVAVSAPASAPRFLRVSATFLP